MASMINVNDLRTAFLYKKTTDLKFTYYIFRLLQYNRLVAGLGNLAQWMLKLHLPVSWLIRATIFKVFCAGETLQEALQKIRGLRKFKVGAVLDYVSEGESSDVAFARNHRIIVENIRAIGAAGLESSVSIKISGLEDGAFLERIDDCSVFKSEQDSLRFLRLQERLDTICRAASEAGVIVYIDAEDRFMQDAIDHLAEEMMRRYNGKQAVVYNTLQMYLRDRLDYLEQQILKAKSQGYFAGIKLVRGAYAEKERERAQAKGMLSPVFDTKKETDASFNSALEICLRHSEFVYTCVASHNEGSTLLAVEYIERYNIQDHTSKVKFSQLLGMSDHLTFNLASEGYNASKYMPYGEVEKAVPYLLRRAEENTSIGGQMSGEVKRLFRELKRRSFLRRALGASAF